jgi:FixJ family two-component response regulator
MTANFSRSQSKEQTVFIVDDDEAICEGLCNLLDSVGLRAEHFGSSEEFLECWHRDAPGCLLLDARLPGMTGVDFQDKLIQAGIHIPIIFMTAHGDVPMVRKVMKAGAVEFLTKPFLKEDLFLAIQQAFNADRVHRSEQSELQLIRSYLTTLTARELEVLDLVTAGSLNKQIAAVLNLSEITVKLHRRHVMEKMHADSLADLVKMTEKVRATRSR